MAKNGPLGSHRTTRRSQSMGQPGSKDPEEQSHFWEHQGNPTHGGNAGGRQQGSLSLLPTITHPRAPIPSRAHPARAAHLTLPGRQKEKTVLGWRREQSLSQQQFISQVPGVKSQTQIGKTTKAQHKVERKG